MRPTSLALGLLSLVMAGSAAAAPIPFYNVINPSPSTFVNSGGATRETLFQALDDVTLISLGVLLDPASSTTAYSWRLYNSDASGAFGAQLFNASTSFVDGGLATYDTNVNVAVASGAYYILQLLTPVATVMGFPLESAQGLPFNTSDGNFVVLDGGANGQVVSNGWLNGILPAFSVGVRETSPPVPEPTCLSLMLLGLAGLGMRRRRRH